MRLPACGCLRLLVAACGCLWLFSVPAYAEEADVVGAVARAYTLNQAFNDALERDARVLAAENRIVQAQERLEEVKSSRRPTLSVTGNTGYAYNRNQARVTSVYEGHSSLGGVQVVQNLFSFGRLQGRLRQVEAGIAEAKYAAEEVRQEVLAEVARSYSEQLFQARILDRRRAFENALAELEEAARQRLALGTLDRTELYVILRSLHRARAERIEASSRYRVSRARLARLTGADRENLAPASLATLELASPASLGAALARGELKSPALARAHQRLEAAEGELAFRKAELWPILSLEVNARVGNVGEIDTRDIGGGVNLAMPLYDGGRKRSKLRSAQLAVETARRELTAERERLGLEVQSNWDLLDGLSMARQEFEAASADIRKVVELTGSKLDVGRATFVQHIEARQSALDAEFDLLDNRLRLEATRIALLRALASLAPWTIKTQ